MIDWLNNHKRRSFLRALAAGGLAYAIGRTSGVSFAQMSGGSAKFADYKALVCVFLYGGNDSWNMVVPMGSSDYDAYFKSRGGGTASSLAIDKSALLPITRGDFVATNLKFGFHPNLAGIQQLFNEGRLAVLPNVGPLIKPMSKQQYLATPSDSKDLPPQLFSHFDQQEQWASLRGRSLLSTGWGGRIGDLVSGGVGAQQLPTNISLYMQSLFQTPKDSDHYVMGQGGADFPGGLGDRDLDNPTTFVIERDDPARRAASINHLDSVLQTTSNSIFERGYARVQKRGLQYAGIVNTALKGAPTMSAFTSSDPPTQLWVQLSTVAKLIAQRASLGMTRQVFFVGLGGFDMHDRQLADHGRLLGDLSKSIRAFFDATVELGVSEQVTLFTQSDFGRTLTSNGDGSDHGWGGSQFVVGSAVNGGRFWGDYPSLAVDGPEVLPFGGAVIPAVSADQYAATLAKWFGVPQQSLHVVAPNLANFTQSDLGFMAG
ncbi:MAG: DUF1501 domain-containing protein [Gammaproteobacteria bacterium]|nr:DUF1501 domain-containing protein [Gammaproteobacteria bacterium]